MDKPKEPMSYDTMMDALGNGLINALSKHKPSMRKIAYDLQRTGNPRSHAEAMKIHSDLDNVHYCPQCGFPTEHRACAPYCKNCGFKGVCGDPYS